MVGHDVRIAVVDGEAFLRDAIRDMLTAAGYECVLAEDGQQALDLAADESVGVMVLDVRLPGAGGIEVLRQLRDQRPDLRVIVLSGSADQELVLEALRLGAANYLAKPLHDEELVLAVGRAVESHVATASARRLRDRLARLAALTEDMGRHASETEGEARIAYLRQAAADGAAELLEAGKTSLMLLSDAGDELRVASAVGRDLSVEEMDPVPVGRGVAGLALERAETLLVESGAGRPEVLSAGVEGRYASDSFALVPVSSGRESFGVLCATDRPGGTPFGVEDVSLLRVLAARVAELLAVARDAKSDAPVAPDDPATATLGSLEATTAPPSANDALELLRGFDRDAELVRGVCDALVNDVEPERVIRAVLEPIGRELGAAPVSLYLLDGATGTLTCEGQLDGGLRADRLELPVASGLTGTVLQSGHLVATQTPERDPRFDPACDTPEDGHVGPLLCVPLRLRGKVVGLCRIFLPEGSAVSARTGELLAPALSAAVRNVLLYRSLVESIEEVAEARRQARR